MANDFVSFYNQAMQNSLAKALQQSQQAGLGGLGTILGCLGTTGGGLGYTTTTSGSTTALGTTDTVYVQQLPPPDFPYWQQVQERFTQQEHKKNKILMVNDEKAWLRDRVEEILWKSPN